MPRKSRGCGNCRKSRKKCDQDQPACQFCRRNNLSCSGRIVGPIIIDQTQRVASRYECDREPPTTEVFSLSSLSPSSRATVSAAFSSVFLSFVSSGSGSASPIIPSWLTRLQDLPWSFRSETALDLALQATATVYCGVHANNLAVIREACALYGQALSLHSRSMTMAQTQPNGPPAAALICTSVVLSLFEAMWPSSLDGYAAHLTAARNMTCATPGLVAETEEATHTHTHTHTELLRQVYVHVLYQSVLTAFTCPIACLNSGELATKSHSTLILWDPSSLWRTRLVTQLFKLGKLVCVLASGCEEAVVVFQLQAIENHLKILWDEHLQERARRRGRKDMDMDVDESSLLPAYFASTTILLSLVKSSTSSSCDNIEAAIETQHQIILDSAIRLLAATPGGVSSSAYLPMYLPIALVALHSTSPERRATASALLDESDSHRPQRTIFRGLSRRIGVSVAQGSSIQLDLRHTIKQSGVRLDVSA
ncbi:hypothetical protein PG984_003122 [Apiospora sp. TS-2023a]